MFEIYKQIEKKKKNNTVGFTGIPRNKWFHNRCICQWHNSCGLSRWLTPVWTANQPTMPCGCGFFLLSHRLHRNTSRCNKQHPLCVSNVQWWKGHLFCNNSEWCKLSLWRIRHVAFSDSAWVCARVCVRAGGCVWVFVGRMRELFF